MTLPQLIDAMEEAGTTDLRGQEDLPLALRVIGKSKNPEIRRATALLKKWATSGAHRIDRNRDGKYDDADAIKLMDAWWPGIVSAMFKPVMGAPLLDQLRATHEIDNAPNNHGDHLGSAYQTGFYGYVKKDLERVLKIKVKQRYARAFCGRGNRSRCRNALIASLRSAIAQSPEKVYPADDKCKTAGDQYCRDEVSFRPLGGVTQPLIHWINRPTYQQVAGDPGPPLVPANTEGLPWSETRSPHFAARHEHADAEDVIGVLELLEGMRERLVERFATVPEDVAVVVHGSAAQLDMAAPYLPVVRRLTAPAARRYLVGWAGVVGAARARPARARRPRVAGARLARAEPPRARGAADPARGGRQPALAAAAVGPAHAGGLPALGVAVGRRRAVAERPGPPRALGHRPAHARGPGAGVPARPARRAACWAAASWTSSRARRARTRRWRCCASPSPAIRAARCSSPSTAAR